MLGKCPYDITCSLQTAQVIQHLPVIYNVDVTRTGQSTSTVYSQIEIKVYEGDPNACY